MTTVLVFAWAVFVVFFGVSIGIALWDGASGRDTSGQLVWNNPTKEKVAGWFSSIGIPAGFAGVVIGLWSLSAWVTR